MNRLAHETSPYLLQHAHNPVDWYAWGPDALTAARDQDKPILVSIGYSACHWCHVMERESFENDQVAAVMNQHFVCIKVDREERPDVDAVYMDALQAMGVQGGWPLNVFLTADAKPFYGLTYAPPREWTQLLANVANAYATQRDELAESAEKFTEHLRASVSEQYELAAPDGATYATEDLDAVVERLARSFDRTRGGTNKAPKFPMPSLYAFLLRYHALAGHEGARAHALLTLDEMAFGGIYDQVGGGFARYSTDAQWFAPHFEKMLYDNGQLVALYADAYALTQDALYRDVVYGTIDFVDRELTSAEGGFYAALDADSEGEEGKFYVWTKDEIDQLLGAEAGWFNEYYHVRAEGNWEHGRNILYCRERPGAYALAHQRDPADFRAALAQAHGTLLTAREHRPRPGLDDKILCSWNGLMLKGLVTAYRVFGEERFLEMALRNAHFLLAHMRRGAGLWHSYKAGRATIVAYLEDYAAVVDAFLHLYQATFDEQWLTEADALAQYAVDNFYDPTEDLFFFTDAQADPLIARKKEVFDNVVPASNSIMATNLYLLGILLDRPDYTDLSGRMLARVRGLVLGNVQYMSHWASLFACRARPTAEIVLVGPHAHQFRSQLDQSFVPNKVVLGALVQSQLPLLQNRPAIDGRTTAYVCYERTCQLPVYSVEEALALL